MKMFVFNSQLTHVKAVELMYIMDKHSLLALIRAKANMFFCPTSTGNIISFIN